MHTVQARVTKVIANFFHKSEEEITPQTHITDDLDADSLDTVELLMAIEEEFDLELQDSDVENLCTVQEIVDYLNRPGVLHVS